MKNQDHNIIEFLEQLHVKAHNIPKILEDINAGDELLGQFSNPEVPPELLERIERTIRSQKPSTRWPKTVGRGAAVLVGALILFGALQLKNITSYFRPANGLPEYTAVKYETNLFDNELDLWELTLTIEEEEIDEIVLTEILMLWDNDEQADDLFGKEQQHESHTHSYNYTVGFRPA